MTLYRPLQVETLSVAGIKESMMAMRLPKNENMVMSKKLCISDKDYELSSRLIKAGTDHAKFTRGIIVWFRMEMQTGFMIEFETYRHGVECLSTSSTMHGELKSLQGSELAEAKQAGLATKVYVRVVTMSYQALRAIYKARRRHRMPDWRIFCKHIETLPNFKEHIFPEYHPSNPVRLLD